MLATARAIAKVKASESSRNREGDLMVEHQTAIMVVAFGLWGLIFVVCPFISIVVMRDRRPRA
jgi:hypothetical protein